MASNQRPGQPHGIAPGRRLVTADLDDACSDLAQWLPQAAALTASPDTAPGPGTRTAPGSHPPWNTEVAGLVYEIQAGLGDVAAGFRQTVTGTLTPRPPYRATGTVLRAISSLGTAVSSDQAQAAARQLGNWITAITQLPAIDVEERPRKIRSACPFCGIGMLRLLPRSGRVTCLRYGACTDSNGGHPEGVLAVSAINGEPRIFWKDGKTT